jgi:hypothetical protein
MKKIIQTGLIVSLLSLTLCIALTAAPYQPPFSDYGMPAMKGGIPTEDEIVKGLKEALQLGSTNAANILHKPGGFLNDPVVKIPFPPDVQRVATILRQHGFGSQVDRFTESLNRAAEDAAIKAAPIFIDAVKTMNLNDAKNILLGANNSATMYFKGKTSNALYNSFSPVIRTSLDKVNATRYWSEITTLYNRIPFVRHIDTDLVRYTTNKALDGVFIKVADEERKIRASGGAQITETLKKVFGWAKTMMK